MRFSYMPKPCLSKLFRQNLKEARRHWGRALDSDKLSFLRNLTFQFHFLISAGDLILTDRGWYVTHAGLLRLARTRRCKGIQVEPVEQFSAPTLHRFAFKATVHKSSSTTGFVGYGDAEP